MRLSVLFFMMIYYSQAISSQESLVLDPKLSKLNMPAYFEQNCGQWNSDAEFMVKLNGYTASLAKNRLSLFISKKNLPPVSITFVTDDLNCKPKGLESLPGKVNYLKGKNPDAWKTNVPIYSKVKYENAFAGTDIVVYVKDKLLEYDFILKPFQDIRRVKMQVDGAKKMEVDPAGNLLLITATDTIVQVAPVAYQKIKGGKVSVKCNYEVKDNYLSFRVGDYDKAYEIVIDPYFIVFSSFLGGDDHDVIYGLEVDPDGNIYLGGDTESDNFGTHGSFHEVNAGIRDGFVAKVNPAGNALIYYTYIGGISTDVVYDIAIDDQRNVYMAGVTFSDGFPVVTPFQNTYGGEGDAFAAKLDPNGANLLFSTYLGGANRDEGRNVEVDSLRNVYVSGNTLSADFPLQIPLDAVQNIEDFFITKFTTDGSGLIFSTYVGGSENDGSESDLAVDNTGDIYFVGQTNSPDFPTTLNAVQPNLAGANDAFFLKIESDGSVILYGTFLGGDGFENANAVALDQENNVYVVGGTTSDNFPTTAGVYQSTYQDGGGDTFVTKFIDGGTNDYIFAYSTYLGGTGNDGDGDGDEHGVEVDILGNVYVVGFSTSEDLFTTIIPLFPNNGHSDATLAVLNSNGTQLIFGTYIGGPSEDEIALDVELDAEGAIYIAGWTQSIDFPAIPDDPAPLQAEYGGGDFDGFFLKLAPIPTFTAHYEYPAKIVCGQQSFWNNFRLLQGVYGTTINIHNPSDSTNQLFSKLALSYPPLLREPGAIYPIGINTLEYDEALKIDCDRIQRELFPGGFPNGHIEGFVVIQSELPLDVAGVYTSGRRRRATVYHSGIEVEYIPERNIERTIPIAADLEIEKSHQLLSPTAGLIYNVTVSNNGVIPANNVVINDIIEVTVPVEIQNIIPIPNPGVIFAVGPIIGSTAEISVSVNNPIPIGGVVTFSYRVVFGLSPPFVDFTVTNNAIVSSSSPDSNLENNSVSTEVEVNF